MRALALLPLLFASPAFASDWEVSAVDVPTLVSALKQVNAISLWRLADPDSGVAAGITTDGTLKNGTVYAINCYGKKFIGGVAQPNVYCILRLIGPTQSIGTVPAGITVIPIPADSPVVFAQ